MKPFWVVQLNRCHQPTDFEVKNLRLEYRIPAKLGDTLVPVVYHIGETIVVSLDIHGEASAIVEFS